MKIFQRRFIHYNELNVLREVENENSLKFLWNFVQEFVNEQNFKERKIIHSLNVVKEFFNNLMIIENDETENKYRADNNKKNMNFNKYEEDDEDENEYKKNQKTRRTS